MVDKPNFEATIGIWSLTALILLLYGWSWLKGLSVFHPPQRFTVQFHDVAGLNNNAPVNVNGVRVGTVDKLSLKAKGQVLVSLKINTEDVTIPQGSTFTIQTLGLVGAKYVEITLPDPQPGAAPPAPIEATAVVTGQDPVRVELVMNRIATNLSHIDYAGVERTLSTNMERVAKAADSVQEVSQKFGDVADDAKSATKNADRFFARGTRSFDNIDQVAEGSRSTMQHFTAFTDDWRTTSHRLNRLLDNPALSSDLRETAQKAKETAQILQSTIHDLTGTIQDPNLRADILASLNKLNTSTKSIHDSLSVVKGMANDQGLRSDLRQILSQARDTMDRVNTLVTQPAFGNDLLQTMQQVKRASTDVDTVAKQLHQVLNQKRPLWKMLTGKPGYLKEMPQAANQAVVEKQPGPAPAPVPSDTPK